jgi:hypothetical protein
MRVKQIIGRSQVAAAVWREFVIDIDVLDEPFQRSAGPGVVVEELPVPVGDFVGIFDRPGDNRVERPVRSHR